ncbi:MAG: hypothetical protein J6O99_06450 [Methanobrevibacter sp.]|nr:hypothetical protein [Methanobrevibacter sp.]MBO5965531.1 hypothetical protein [Methanobrevibacter sp.]MBO6105519.1 hypothetical protein [Methanobrevibacter sp.]MBO7159677.1 hypothetical protein [Methanobrevibacter sp.]MBO7241265.1 hypothetical protein [Methanobrevibacter sp.]
MLYCHELDSRFFEENSLWQVYKNGGSLCLSNQRFGWHWSCISFICGAWPLSS